MDQTHSRIDRSPTAPVGDDPVTTQQLREPVDPVLAGRDPGAMDGAVGAHDGSDRAGATGWSTSEAAGTDVQTNYSEGRPSTQADLAAADDRDLHGRNPEAATRPPQGRDDSGDGGSSGGSDRGGAEPVDSVGAAIGHDVVALLDLPRWTEHLHALPTWQEGDRASSMLLRQPPVRVLLTALRRDAELGSDGAQETLMLLVLSGAASVEWRGEVARIGQGELAVVPAGGGWRISSEAAETLVLSTFWGTPGTGVADEAGR